ncbi:variant erythrocyte surface antigen-1, beta subunit [Babesia divergens]|uniref:Variant erythrocyte surface antigen-1, beta subunit n=1 Tax=Babesia divergens TaxID=32595 RepID=A0AAD9G5G6_BABDI|nr:variant erythrocyte surface antigen-1, beta subunit [Babesia divergens]
MVCCMYYTDVFVGSDNNINKLKNALKAELEGSVDSVDLTQLVHGLCLFMGYPSCVCSLKANVDKSLQDISGKLIQDSEAVQSCLQNKTLTLNCSNCNSKEILCKCCVISCIKELPGQSQCECVKNASKDCQCPSNTNGKCCKDFLSGLEACLSLLNLKTDMEDCTCVGDTCCENGTCTDLKCDLCNPSKFPDNAMTGLGICPMNPKKLAEKLEEFFGSGQKSGCSCNGSPCSCCCLACQSCSSKKSCFCLPNSQCSCASKLQLPKDSPCKTFCSKIKDVKVLVRSKEMTCCNKGTQCHCQVEGSKCSTSDCCVVSDKSGAGSDHYQHSVKCMLRRVVKFFASFDPSKPGCPKLCCEIFCVLKCCVFLKMFYDKGGKKSCGKCKEKGGNPCKGSTLQSQPPSNNCCRGKPSACKSGNCCLGCQDCDAIKFRKAFNALQYSSPCGQDLYCLLKDLLNFCSNVMHPNQDFIRDTVLEAVNSCPSCHKSGTDSSDWKACECSSGPSSCQACPKLLENSKLMSILRHGYLSSYSEASWTSLTSSTSGSGPCCGSSSSCSQCSPSGCSSSGSCPSKCCPDCPQRKAAKIFLGMLPCLYYGLKILYERCKYGSGFAGWHDITVSNDKPESALAKFLQALGYDLRPLKTKKGSEFFPFSTPCPLPAHSKSFPLWSPKIILHPI